MTESITKKVNDKKYNNVVDSKRSKRYCVANNRYNRNGGTKLGEIHGDKSGLQNEREGVFVKSKVERKPCSFE